MCKKEEKKLWREIDFTYTQYNIFLFFVLVLSSFIANHPSTFFSLDAYIKSEFTVYSLYKAQKHELFLINTHTIWDAFNRSSELRLNEKQRNTEGETCLMREKNNKKNWGKFSFWFSFSRVFFLLLTWRNKKWCYKAYTTHR